MLRFVRANGFATSDESPAQNHSLLLRYDARKLASVYLTNDREPPWACNIQARKQSNRRWILPWAGNVDNGGIMLDPTREVDWVECILKTAKGGGDRHLMIDGGLERVRMFSWKKTVEQHLEVYRRLVW